MRQWIRPHLTYANIVATLSLFLVVGGGTALASYVVSSNSQIASNAISGHKPPSGKHANIIKESVNATDIAPASIGNRKLTNGAATASKIATGAVTSPKLAANSVTGISVLDGSLTGQDLQNGAITTANVGQGFLTQAGGDRALRFFAHEWSTGTTTNNDIAFGRVTLHPTSSNHFQVCFNFIGTWGYGISIDGGALVTHTQSTGCGPTETLTTGGSFQITDGQDIIFGSGDSSSTGYYFVYAFYSP
jgi:hypothetical protein